MAPRAPPNVAPHPTSAAPRTPPHPMLQFTPFLPHPPHPGVQWLSSAAARVVALHTPPKVHPTPPLLPHAPHRMLELTSAAPPTPPHATPHLYCPTHPTLHFSPPHICHPAPLPTLRLTSAAHAPEGGLLALGIVRRDAAALVLTGPGGARVGAAAGRAVAPGGTGAVVPAPGPAQTRPRPAVKSRAMELAVI